MSALGRSRRAWGWHRLHDEWAARVVSAAAVRPGELVFDIGAGEGALTAHLVRAGARVVAVELHPRRVGVLRERFPGITVVHADAASIRLPGRPFRVVANPPYGISSRLLRTLLAPNSGLVAADLVLQRALVCKFASRNARRFTLTVGLMLPRRAFLPPPHVDSAVLVVRPAMAWRAPFQIIAAPDHRCSTIRVPRVASLRRTTMASCCVSPNYALAAG